MRTLTNQHLSQDQPRRDPTLGLNEKVQRLLRPLRRSESAQYGVGVRVLHGNMIAAMVRLYKVRSAKRRPYTNTHLVVVFLGDLSACFELSQRGLQ